MRVVVADDNVLVRTGLVALLTAQEGFDVVAECGDYESLDRAVRDFSPDVVVTDIRMPPGLGDEGIRFAVALRERGDRAGVVVLSQYAEPSYALALLGSGSAGRAYLLKERLTDVAQVVAAVESVARGGSFVDADVVDALVRVRGEASGSRLERLSPREREVLSLMAEGRSNAGIAAALVLSYGAVEKHINAILQKLELPREAEVHRRVAAVLLFLSARSGSMP